MITKPNHSINNAQQILDKIKDIKVEEDAIVRHHSALYFNRLETGNTRRTPPKHHLDNPLEKPTTCELTSLFLGAYVEFDGNIHEQIKGTPKGSPISRFHAEAMMQALEDVVLPKIRPKI